VLLCLVAMVAAGACSGGGDDDGGSSVSAGGGDEDAGADDGRRRVLDAGTDGPSTAGEIVAKSATEWQEKWSASGATAAAPDVAEVDFEREVVVGIFAGEKPSGGWSIDPDVDVKIQNRFGAVNYTVVGPGDGCQSSQAMTSPYLVLAVRADSVRFVSSERMDPCE
jgi:hypothetical protein